MCVEKLYIANRTLYYRFLYFSLKKDCSIMSVCKTVINMCSSICLHLNVIQGCVRKTSQNREGCIQIHPSSLLNHCQIMQNNQFN